MSRGKRLGVRRRKLLGARSYEMTEADLRKAAKYRCEKAVPRMKDYDNAPPLVRALVGFFGADVLARLPPMDLKDVAKRLGKKAEFDAYYEEVYGLKIRAKETVEQERIASAWDGIL